MKLDLTQATDDSKSYVNQGGVYEFEIDSVTSETSPTGSEYIQLSMHVIETGEIHTERLYMTGKAVPYAIKKLKHIGTKFTTEDLINDCTSTEDINELFKGGQFRARIRTEDYMNSNGEKRTRCSFGLPRFAEAIVEGGDYPPVPKESSTLKYDPVKDHTPLEPVPEGETSGAPESTGGLY